MSLDLSVEFWSDPQMSYVETRRACQSRICYQTHSHTTFSIGAVDVGQSRFSSNFSAEEKIESGSLVVIPAHIRPLAKVNLRASNSVFLQLNSFLNQIVSVYSYSVLLISENA